MQVLDRRKALSITPLFRLAFRPFFLGACLFAALAIPLWLLALGGMTGAWQPAGGWLAWHRHELLFGFGLAIIAGFLLTAVQTWTGRPGLSGKPLAALASMAVVKFQLHRLSRGRKPRPDVSAVWALILDRLYIGRRTRQYRQAMGK